ncbi:uncharacterized protein LOC131876611 [Cryptomeria japonica]|uniref:uncharacterized protein LOC131876611 n=1 Tax=Cryptomeria japonica TaxID=3369 RepID=UPI0027DA3687|nr:uncharacterized protein LOC131876611 [Cryptomeria japonica]
MELDKKLKVEALLDVHPINSKEEIDELISEANQSVFENQEEKSRPKETFKVYQKDEDKGTSKGPPESEKPVVELSEKQTKAEIPPPPSINHKHRLPISTYQLILLFLCIHIHTTISFVSFIFFPTCLLPAVTATVLIKASAPRSVTALGWRLLRKTSTSALNWRWVRMTANVDHPALALVAPATVPDHHHRHHL